MREKKIIAVVGATGQQGGGLVRAIMNDNSGKFKARALTRDPNSDKAHALGELGAEVVQVDLQDESSVTRAFEGAHGAYCVTFYFAHMSPEREFADATILANAIRNARVEHAIWSTLEDTRKFVPLDDPRMPTIMGKYKVPHFDAKGEADELFRKSGVPVTYLLASFYWDNLLAPGRGPTPDANGDLVLNMLMSDRKLAGIAAEDIGKCALGIFKRGTELTGQRIGIASDHLTGNEIAEKISKALGKPVRYNPVPFAAFRKSGMPLAEEVANMFQFYVDFEEEVLRSRDIARSRELDPELQSFDEWLARNKSQFAGAASSR
ncbi:MAG TPA: NmrA/HSCARG family protein [Gemmatimonadaceae bacterium]|nr:NmrA/HSCARG family protein [Gemmatimonadaceae bacterium]